jgi:anti-sigma-K factor RskA
MWPDMSDGDPTSENRACGDDVAAYALGALDLAEAEAFREHLETCTVCRDELAAFESVVNVLPLSSAGHPAPPHLRRKVMRAVANEPKHAPAARAAAARGLQRWRVPRPALAFAAALAVAVAVFVGVNVAGSGSGGSSTRIIHAQVTGQGNAELKLAGGHAELVVHDFSPPPAGEIYEIWLQRGHGSPSPAHSLFGVSAAGDAVVDVPDGLHGVSLVMVTPEPAGGSLAPTHPAVISASLT